MTRPLMLALALIAVVSTNTEAQTNFQRSGINAPSASSQFLMNQIQAQSIGTGFTVGSQNANTLARGTNVSENARFGQFAGTFPRPTSSSGSIFGTAGAPSQKPFANASRGPTVSPWLGLFGNGVTSTDFNYNTIVRPMLQQQETNRNLQRQQQELGQRFQQLSGQPAFDPRGSQSQAPTGHTTVFQYFSHFYPSKGQRPARR